MCDCIYPSRERILLDDDDDDYKDDNDDNNNDLWLHMFVYICNVHISASCAFPNKDENINLSQNMHKSDFILLHLGLNSWPHLSWWPESSGCHIKGVPSI